MTNERVFRMKFSAVYPLLVNKAIRKGRTKEEVDRIIGWMTGYEPQQLEQLMDSQTDYATFFENAPCLNPRRLLISGSICGVKLESIEDPLMRDIRALDKLIDELAKGKPMEKILR
ncbi:MAG: DUF2200 domain-containing protein [Candidatus Limiplasma sp.]|nr:DUF2200 domain-containing protein [Candidatus Limiplasma sp.]